MSPILILNLWVFICALIGMVYGLNKFFEPRKALYLKMITLGVVCLMFSRLFYVVYLFTQEHMYEGFNVGMLGIIGSFMFFFSANYGQMDGLVDDRSKQFIKTRIIALLAPILIIVLYVLFAKKLDDKSINYAILAVVLFICPCAYYNFKHIIIYDVELGLIKTLRTYNVLALLYAFLTMFEFIGEYLDIKPVLYISYIGIGIIALVMLPVLGRSGKKWTI